VGVLWMRSTTAARHLFGIESIVVMQERKGSMYSKDNLKKLPKMAEILPEAMSAFHAWDKIALADGAIPKKYKELIAIAVALTTQCPYCIEVHRQQALKAGATEREMTEVIHVAAALRAGAAITHGTHLLEG
jgi:AhpD family alkylhydroperoxidase